MVIECSDYYSRALLNMEVWAGDIANENFDPAYLRGELYLLQQLDMF